MEQVSLLEAPERPGAAPAWLTLDEQQRAEIVATLARLIAKTIVATEDAVARGEGATDE